MAEQQRYEVLEEEGLDLTSSKGIFHWDKDSQVTVVQVGGDQAEIDKLVDEGKLKAV